MERKPLFLSLLFSFVALLTVPAIMTILDFTKPRLNSVASGRGERIIVVILQLLRFLQWEITTIKAMHPL